MPRVALSLLAALVFATAGPVVAQDEAAPTQARARWSGLAVEEITERLTAAGLTVEEPRTNADRVYLRVTDGPLRWVLTLFSCTDGHCPDVQFTAAFAGANATPEIISRWDGERRFVKAFYAAPDDGTEGQAVAQYDVLLNPLVGPTQLDDPIQIWRSLAVDLGRTVASQPPTP